MCLFSVRPEYDVEFANRPARKKKVVAYVPERSSTRISETIIRDRPAQYVQAPRSSAPLIRPATPPRSIRSASPPATRIELVSVEESRSSPRTSRVSVSGGKGKRREGRGTEEVYIERERERVRLKPAELEYDTYRYIEAPMKEQRYLEDGIERRRSRSITYETNPRLSGRLVERERVVVEDGGRRREYYRRP